ncbi:MAG: hypothetical protein HRT94_03680 [Alphaproteobacteria bacterium]|nr:hypothetical protein [Alphaproteobacteria bacterium]
MDKNKKILVIVGVFVLVCLVAAGTYKYLADKKERDIAQAYMDGGMNVNEIGKYLK